APLPDISGFAAFASWLIEGCRIAQPLAPLAGTRVTLREGLLPGALVSVQGRLELDGASVLVGAPALLGAPGAAASLLIHPVLSEGRRMGRRSSAPGSAERGRGMPRP